MAQRDYNRASLEFRNAILALPNEAEGYYQAGLASLAAGNIREAAGAFRKTTELNPNHVEAQVKFAGMLAASRDKALVEDASSRLKQVLSVAPDNKQAADTLAFAEGLMGNTSEASHLLEGLLAKSPADLRTSLTLAQLKAARKDLDGAEEVLAKAAANNPKSADALVHLGWFHLGRRKLDLAQAEIQQALALDPQNLIGMMALGVLHVQSHRVNEAEAVLKKLSEHPDKSYEAVYGAFLFDHGKREEALKEFQRLAAVNPDDRTARQRLYNILVAMKRLPDAEKLMADALKRNPKDSDALVRRGEMYVRSGRIREAEADIQQVLHFMPDSADAHLAMAKLFALQGLGKSERQELSEALKLNPRLLPARAGLARSLTVANDTKGALALLDAAPSEQKDSLGVIAARNWAYLKAGNVKAARPLIDRVLKMERVPEVVLQDGYARIQEHDFRGAMSSAEELLRQRPGNVQAARLLADASMGQNQTPVAIDRLRRLVTQTAAAAESAPLQILLGELLSSQGDRAEARQAFEAAKAAAPESADPDIALAQLDFKERRFEEVRKRMAVLTAADKHNSRALLLLANAGNAAGDRTAAMKGYRDVLEFDPANLIALNNLAYLTAYQNPDEALAVAQKAMEIAPDSPGLHDTLGWVYYRKASYPRAIEYLEMAVRKDPTPTYEYHLGKAYVKVGEENRGTQLIAKALQKNPDLIKSEQDW